MWDPDSLRQDLRRRYPGANIDVFGGKFGDERYLRLNLLVVPESKRGLGMGTTIMKALCEYADEHRALIVLSPINDQGVRYRNRLVRWYKAFGFVENKGRRKDFRFMESMYRRPQVAER